jgi:hypothetical protein
MRRQDEIRLLLSGRDPGTQKFLLAELDRFAHAFDADEVHDVLVAHLASPAAEVARQSLATLTQFLDAHAPRRYGLVPTTAGLWTAIHLQADREEKAAPGLTAAQARMRRAAAALLAPLAAELAGRLDTLAPEVRSLACAALALSPGGHRALAARLEREPASFSILWAWAVGGGGAADPGRLAEILAARGAEDPDFLLAARVLPGPALAELAAKLEPKLEWRGRAHLALAAAAVADRAAAPLLARLGEPRTDWGDVYVLRAAEQLKGPEAWQVVLAMHARSPHEFVRQQALRAAGGFASPEAVQFCLALLGREPAHVSQCLESLVRLRCPSDNLTKAAAPYRESADLRARVAALLATSAARGERLPASLVPLLRHAEPLPRVEAAFCLGYWPGAGSLKVLAALAAHDPHPQVRQQAIKSLSRFDVGACAPLLTRLVKTADKADALTAARVMVRMDTDSLSTLVHLFLTELVKCADPGRRALLLRGLGRLAAGAADPGVLRVFSAALSVDAPEVLEAALDGIKTMGGPPTPEVLAQVAALARGGPPAVALSAHVALFLAGDLGAPERVIEALRAGEPGTMERAVTATLELVLLATRVIGPQHEALAKALGCEPTGREPVREPAPAKATVVVPVFDEGEWEISRPGGDAEAESVDSAALAESVRASEAPTVGAGIDVRTHLESATNLVPKTAFARADAPKMRSRPAPKLPAKRSWRRVAVALAVAVAVAAVGAVALTRDEGAAVPEVVPPAATAAPAALTVWQVKGTLRLIDRANPLERGETIAVGQTVVLSEGGNASLVTGLGDEVRLASGAQLKVVAVRAPGSLMFEPQAGSMSCAFGPGRTVTFVAGRRTITGPEMRLWLAVVPGGWAVKSERTAVEAVASDGSARRLAPGEEAILR